MSNRVNVRCSRCGREDEISLEDVTKNFGEEVDLQDLICSDCILEVLKEHGMDDETAEESMHEMRTDYLERKVH